MVSSKINNEMKWIHSPSAKFEGTKASLIQDAAPTRTKRAAAMYAAPIEENNGYLWCTFKRNDCTKRK